MPEWILLVTIRRLLLFCLSSVSHPLPRFPLLRGSDISPSTDTDFMQIREIVKVVFRGEVFRMWLVISRF